VTDALVRAEPDQGLVNDLVIVSNRLPVVRTDDGWEAGSGGLVSAMAPIAIATQAAWVGWLGDADDLEPERFSVEGVDYVPVGLSANDVELFYEGFSNGVLWPLYHDALRPPNYDHTWFQSYRQVNRLYADVVCRTAAPGATVWVHDYQLQLVPGFVRERRPDLRIGFFLHIPFPPVELFEQLPWRVPILEGVLGADVVGFQTAGHAENFLRAVERLVGPVANGGEVVLDGHHVRVDAFPISIDVEDTERVARRPEVVERADELRRILGEHRIVLLGVDRLDYTKGIDRRLAAMYALLDAGRLDPADLVMVQVAVPTREDAAGYGELRQEVERLVGAINGRFATIGAPVVHYLYRSIDATELAALYRVADVMLVTPLRDGMNLVAKEYVAGHVEGGGVLVLSEFAGAAQELSMALLVNPFDELGMAGVIERAVRMTPDERSTHLDELRASVAGADVHVWAQRFLDALNEP
jgi:trehalose 6-phosphate synthase